MTSKNSDPFDNWYDDFENRADEELGDGSACEQIHPIVEKWFDEWLDSDPPEQRGSVLQAISCLSTEVVAVTPEEILSVLMENLDEDVIAEWVQGILMTGQAFQRALDSGRLDDL
jgi:hypothetical protein